MSTLALPLPVRRYRRYYRPMILTAASLVLLGVFWFATRYPQLLSMAYGSELLHAAENMALPWTMSLVKYGTLLLLIVVGVPALIAWLEHSRPFEVLATGGDRESSSIPLAPTDCRETLWSVFKELAHAYTRNVWMLVKPTPSVMLLASLLAAAMLASIPWQTLLSQVTPLRLALVSLISVFMPVPIALDVMFASHLQQQGIASGYVMLFAMALGTYSVIPCIYLWREVSRPLAVILSVFFMAVGWITDLVY